MSELHPLKPETLYENLATELTGHIQSGMFKPGERLPSVRNLSQQKGISVTTVLQAYQLLEDKGLVEARPQSGYFVRARPLPQISQLEAEAFVPLHGPEEVRIDNLAVMVLRDSIRPNLVHFGAALPAQELLPSTRLNRILARLARQNSPPSNLLGTPEGCIELRTQISRRSAGLGCTLYPDELVVTNGCSEAISLALRAVCKSGDLVAVESPTHFGILQAMESQGLQVLEITTHPRTGISLDALGFALEHHPIRAVVVITNFNNPLGSCMPDENKRALVDLLGRYEIPLIEDDICGELAFSDRRPLTAKSFDRQDLVLLCSSYTKDIAPSFRIGWIAPGRYRSRVVQLKLATNLSTAMLPQLVIAEFLDTGGYDRHLRMIRRAYAQKTAQMANAVLDCFPEGTRVTSPSGGFVLWVQLPEKVDSLTLYHKALDAGITLAPGYIFSATPKYSNFIRLNAAYMNFSAHRALERLGEIVLSEIKA